MVDTSVGFTMQWADHLHTEGPLQKRQESLYRELRTGPNADILSDCEQIGRDFEDEFPQALVAAFKGFSKKKHIKPTIYWAEEPSPEALERYRKDLVDCRDLHNDAYLGE